MLRILVLLKLVRINLAQNSWPYELRNNKFFSNFRKSWSERYWSQVFTIIGTLSAVFHIVGSCCSLKLLLRIEQTGWARISAYSFRTQFDTQPTLLYSLSIARYIASSKTGIFLVYVSIQGQFVIAFLANVLAVTLLQWGLTTLQYF